MRFVGEPVAVVLSETLDAGKDAAEAVMVDYRELPLVTDAVAALKPESPKVWDDVPDNIGFLWKRGDGNVIDGLGPDGIAKAVIVLMRDTVRLQTGYIYHYAFVMLIGVTLIATVFAIPPDVRQHFHDAMVAWLRTAA